MSFGSGTIHGFPQHQPPTRPPIQRWQIVGGLIFFGLTLVVVAARGIATFYTDYLWFKSVNLASVWTGLLGTKVLLALLAALFIGALVWINFYVVERIAPRALMPTTPSEAFVAKWRELSGAKRALQRTALALVVAIVLGFGFYSHWHEWLLFWNGGSFGQKDPLFQKDLGFFVFQLPFIATAVQWITFLLLVVIAASIAAHFVTGSISVANNRMRITNAAKAHIAVLMGLFAIARAGQYVVERYQLNFSRRSDQVYVGAGYADAKFMLPALSMLILISLLAAVMFVVSARSRRWSIPIATIVLWGVVSVVIGGVVPAAVQRFVVKPAESQKEPPYLQRNIDATRKAMGIENVKVHSFDYQSKLSVGDINDNAQTIRNIRLWDSEITKPSYQRLQESRSFFNFSDIDVDRYQKDGQTTQVMLSVRELNSSQLPAGRRSWVNERLQYTHGFGAVVSPANAVTSDGKPVFTLKDVPPTGQPQLSRPEVYFGEKATRAHYVIASSGQPEIDYVSSDGRDQTSQYQGKGGVPLDNIVKRAALAARVGEIEPLISSSVGKHSKAMYLTNITDRAKTAAPFLHFDNDAYPVIMDGRILWIQDAYTTTNSYPYGAEGLTRNLDNGADLKGKSFNYIRNSVKVVTDAYDGTMTFYVVDKSDPIIAAWQKAFPKLFTDGATMSEELRAHLRYPEDLFRIQTDMFGEFHMTDAQTFYTKSDRWNIAQQPPRSPQAVNNTTTTTDGETVRTAEKRIDPYYLLMKLPKDERESFLLFQPFVPHSANDQRKELSAFMTAKSDPQSYGQLDAFEMPRDQQIDGPSLIDARINSEPTLARQIALLNQQGSRVAFGDLLIVPIKSGLVYVRPLYVVAQNTQVPEFKAAIVVHGDKIAMEPTLSKALEAVFGSSPGTLEEGTGDGPVVTDETGNTPGAPGTGTTGTTQAATPPASGESVKQLLDRAKSEFDAADRALREGDLSAYQQHVKAGMALADQARNATQ